MTQQTNISSALPGKYLTFKLQSEHFSLPVLRVREIMRMCPITPVPRMPDYIKGVINLRGKIIPVIDLRDKFDLKKMSSDADDRRCIIVAQFNGNANVTQQMGMIVDAVEDVANFSDTDLEDAPDFGSALNTRYIKGMAKKHGSVRTLLDLDRLLNMEGVIQMLIHEKNSTEKHWV